MKVALVNDGPVTITLDSADTDLSKEKQKEMKLTSLKAKQAERKKTTEESNESTNSFATSSSAAFTNEK